MIIRADARHLPLADSCVHCCVTSPPYWGLRQYPDDRQIGLEPTPEAYVQSLVQVFRDVWRVLREDGTVWLNLGDSYSGSGKGGNPDGGKQSTNRGSQSIGVLYGKTGQTARDAALTNVSRIWTAEAGIRAKQLIGTPWRVAFALQADGWYLRSDIIWSKPNPMPESVTDRPTKAHEYLFLLAKSERYHYDAKAIAEPASPETWGGFETGYNSLGLKDYDGAGAGVDSGVKNGDSCCGYGADLTTRNRRSVWSVPTMPYAGAHFATMPEALVEPCILAGCPLGGLVLDPFCGTGTVLAVAARTGRRGVGIDLSYQELAKERTAQRGLMFGASATC